MPKGVNRGTLLKFKLNEVVNKEENESDEPQSLGCYTLDNLPVKRAVFIDSTWNQSRSIFKDPRIKQLRPVVLQNRLSQFWRHQKGSPRWFLATIEGIIGLFIRFMIKNYFKFDLSHFAAIHQFLLEVHIHAWGLDRSYRGLDPLEIEMNFIRDDMIVDGTVNEQNSLENSNETSNLLAPYNGQYDNLFFFFTHMYHLIHSYYDHNILLSYRRPIL